MAARIAQELGGPLGREVGYKIRFADRTGPDCRIKLMTDGILLAEIQRDRYLRQYDALIIDEAHERSLNIDFLLGYLKSIRQRRPDLRLIVTSATIDPERLSAHFDDAPVIPHTDLPRIPRRPIVVSVAGLQARTEIREALSEMGFDEVRDYVCAA